MWGVGWDQSFSLYSHLLKGWIVQDVSGASVVYQHPVGVIVSYLYTDYECIIMWVVETSGIFLYEPNYGIVDLCHL